MKDWSFRGEGPGRGRPPSAAFDPISEGAKYELAVEVSSKIWKHACLAATDRNGNRDERQAQEWFHELAARIQARGGRLPPDVGKVTLVQAERFGGSSATWNLDRIAAPAPGRTTLVLAEEQRQAQAAEAWGKPPESAATSEKSPAPAAPGDRAVPRETRPALTPRQLALRQKRGLPGLLSLTDAEPLGVRASEPEGRDRLTDTATAGPPQPGQSTPLDPVVGSMLSQVFGRPLRHVRVVPESPAVTGATKAITKDGEVHFRAGAYQPNTPHGFRVLAHEVTHVLQQHGGSGEREGSRKELEREADRAATLAMQGRPVRIALRAQPTATYAYSEGEDLDEQAEAAADTAPAEAKTDHAENTHHVDAKPEDTAGEPAAPDSGDATHTISGADTADVMAVVPAEGSAPGAPGGGGGPAPKPQKAAPNVAAAKPEAGLGQLRGVRPDKLGPALGQVHTAAATDTAHARAAQQANPPKQMSTGGVAAAASGAKGAPPKDDVPPPANGDAADMKKAAAHPVKGEVPGGEADKQAKQSQAVAQQKSAGDAITAVRQSIGSLLTSLFGNHGPSTDAKAAKMSDAETRQMAGSVDNLSTSASGVSTDVGPAPELAMKGEAKSSADKDRADLETKTCGLEAQGQADSHVPMGEDHIDPTAPPVELIAAPTAGAAASGPTEALPSLAGAASSEEVGFVAQEQHGAEVDAALAKASTDATAERGKHTAEEAKARAESDTHLRELKTTADAEQATARDGAQAEVHAARAQWQTEITAKGSDARKQADAKVSEGMAQVETEQTKANAEAKKHVEEGKQKADQEKQKGEKEAADAKEKGKSKSSGFLGWMASKAKAAFDGIKKAVSSAIDACKRAVKAVIDAAKKLAMAAIELARKAIVAAIKAVGAALIAISNVLLAAFPGLKAKFQNAIRGAVNKAVAAVSKLADGLKKAVQKALDLLGAALDKALQLLEKGINAIIDAANAVVQGAIKAAQAVVDALGTWAKLIKDVVTGPGAWISKLGAAVVDGIKNHLWSAFKTAVMEWFKSKVFELLGVGGIILELLLEGGLTREHIIQMALDALIVAIPAALIMILVEKLVSMIVPAAGALMTVIEGLQAAWGTVSRIIAAFGAFMAFLLAVKSGGAGPLFATVLASAAVVVLDFVANWLLKKLASAARKVGSKLKGLAEKFKAKRKAKKDAKSPTKHHDDHDDNAPNKHDHDGDPDKKKAEDKKEETSAQKQARLDAAIAEVKGLMSKRQRLSLLLRARLALIRRRHKLDKLEAKKKGSPNAWDIFAKVNPEAHFDLFSIEDDASDLRKAVSGALRTLPPTSTIFDVKRLCAQAAASHLAPGHKLDWQDMRDSAVLFLERPGHPIPRTAVGEFRKTINFRQIGKQGDQTLFADDEQREYVHDAVGQHVPRILTRNISQQDKKALNKGQDVEPSARKRNIPPRDHVIGFKPSPYISTSKLDGDQIENPHGDMLGGEHGTVRIDLLMISPKRILDLTTRKGQNTWNLSNPGFVKGAPATTTRQALEDAIRTQEVLIKGDIPFAAIERL